MRNVIISIVLAGLLFGHLVRKQVRVWLQAIADRRPKLIPTIFGGLGAGARVGFVRKTPWRQSLARWILRC